MSETRFPVVLAPLVVDEHRAAAMLGISDRKLCE